MSRRRVDLVAPPMSGHLHPVLGIADALRGTGSELDACEVRVISTPAGVAEAEAGGFATSTVLAGRDEEIRALVDPPERIGSDPRKLLTQFRGSIRLQADFRSDLLRLWGREPPDLVIADFVVPAAGSAALERGLPWWTSCPSPCALAGRTGPPAYFGGLRPGRGPIGRARDALGRTATRAFKEAAIRVFAREVRAIGFDRVLRADGTEAAYSPETVLALTPARLEYQRALPAVVRHVGPLGYTPPHPSPAPPFVQSARHVLITAGTHLPWHKQRLVDAAVAVASASPRVQVHLSLAGEGARRPARPPANLHVLDYIAYGRDLAHYDLVCHHAGAGVSGHCLRAGVPAVVTPVDYDQPDFAVRLVDAGVAVAASLSELPQVVPRALARSDLRRAAASYAAELSAAPPEDRIRALVSARLAGGQLA